VDRKSKITKVKKIDANAIEFTLESEWEHPSGGKLKESDRVRIEFNQDGVSLYVDVPDDCGVIVHPNYIAKGGK
jgi:hypothetical protein